MPISIKNDIINNSINKINNDIERLPSIPNYNLIDQMIYTANQEDKVINELIAGGGGYGGVTEQETPYGFATPPNFNGTLPKSLFNRTALYNYSGYLGNPGEDEKYKKFIDYNQSSYNFMFGNHSHGFLNERLIVEWYKEFHKDISYRANDFIYNKWFGKIPPNYLITLRRFSTPCSDNIFNFTTDDLTNFTDEDRKKGIKPPRIKPPQFVISTATTYLGEETGNKLEDILKMSFQLNWKEQTSELQSIQTHEQTTGNGFWDNNNAASLFAQTLNGISPGQRFREQLNAGNGTDYIEGKYGRFVLGPINVIDKMYTRDRGLDFGNEYSLNFEYDMKSIYMVNPKIAMLDIISNMLTMGYNQGDFWGGGVRYYGSTQYNKVGKDLYGNLSLLRSGDFIGYAKSVGEAVSKKFGVKSGFSGGDGKAVEDGGKGSFFKSLGTVDVQAAIKTVLELIKNGLGNLMGDFLNDFAGGMSQPASQVPKALLSGEDTGYWHVVVGNPINPIIAMGNMILDKTEMTFGDGLGFDDFPTEVKFKCDLKHGRGRDIGDIENMFNIGNGRMYDAPSNIAAIDVFNGNASKHYGNVNVGQNKFAKTQSMKAIQTNHNKDNTSTKDFIAHSIMLQFE